MDFETLQAIRTIAFAAALKPDYAFLYNRMCRWYSREFSTSLTEVEKLSEEKILQTWFEDQYDKMANSTDPEDKKRVEETISDFLKSMKDESGLTLEEQMATEDDAWEREMLEEVQRSEAEAAKKRSEKTTKKKKIPENKNLPEPNLLNEELHVSRKGESET